MEDAPKWTPADEAMRWLNEVDKVQGGANGPTIKLRAALLTLIKDANKSERRAVVFSDIIDRHCIAMQAALIEQSIGKGDDAALEWIANTLDGPGLLPSMSDAAHLPNTPKDGPAQAWFDAKLAEPRAKRRGWRLNERGVKLFADMEWQRTKATEGKA